MWVVIQTVITHFPREREIFSFGSGYGGENRECFTVFVELRSFFSSCWCSRRQRFVGQEVPGFAHRFSDCSRRGLAGWSVCLGFVLVSSLHATASEHMLILGAQSPGSCSICCCHCQIQATKNCSWSIRWREVLRDWSVPLAMRQNQLRYDGATGRHEGLVLGFVMIAVLFVESGLENHHPWR